MEQKIPTALFFRGCKVENRQIKGSFDEIFIGCQIIFGEKMRFHIKWNLYCQTKVTNVHVQRPSAVNLI